MAQIFMPTGPDGPDAGQTFTDMTYGNDDQMLAVPPYMTNSWVDISPYFDGLPDEVTLELFPEMWEPMQPQYAPPADGMYMPAQPGNNTGYFEPGASTASKRPLDHDESPEPSNGKHKRSRKIEDGYPCTKCSKRFNRAGDLNKHKYRVHTPDDEKPCLCTHCEKRFLYPKDVLRHERQMHSISPGAQLAENSTTPQKAPGSSDEDENDDDDDGDHPQSPHSNSPATDNNHARLISACEAKFPDLKNTPLPQPGKPVSKSLATALNFARGVVLLKGSLRLRRKSAAETAGPGRYILVTTDRRNLREVDVTGIDTLDALADAVRKQFDMPAGRELTFHRYVLGRGSVEALSGEQLLLSVKKQADGSGTLKLHVSPIKEEGGVSGEE